MQGDHYEPIVHGIIEHSRVETGLSCELRPVVGGQQCAIISMDHHSAIARGHDDILVRNGQAVVHGP